MDRNVNDLITVEVSEVATTVTTKELGELELALVGGGIGDRTL